MDASISSHDDHSLESISKSDVTYSESKSTGSGGRTADEELGTTQRDRSTLLCARRGFVVALFVFAIVLAVLAYHTLHKEETEDFENQFESIAAEVIQLSNSHVKNVLGIMEGLAVTATSFVAAEHASSGYPNGFMTIPEVEKHFEVARESSESLVIAYLPRIEASEVDRWAKYSRENQGWIGEANENSTFDAIKEDIWRFDDDDRRELSSCGGPGRRLKTKDELEDRVNIPSEEGPFAPIWTYSPPPPPDATFMVNFNLFEKPVFKKAADFMEYTRKPAFLDVCNQAAWFSIDQYSEQLQTVLAHPVFDSNQEDAEIVGYLVAIIPWETFFANILRPGTQAVKAVLENTCGDVFTFTVVGPEAIYEGEGDFHDTQFDSMKVNDFFADFVNPPELLTAGLGEVCAYTISMYPTVELEDAYETRQPMIISSVVVSIFALTSVLFFMFDCLVQARHRKVMTTAKRQNAIVSSLFPKSVQAQILAEVDSEKNLPKSGRAGLRHYLMHGDDKTDEKAEGSSSTKSKPIADPFPATTIMFADISGFTAWSSAREPSQVFTLLEGIYHDFDHLAKKRKVFKVEVVGDCYVAVCGLPEPRADHALVMARYARDCVRRMTMVVKNLETDLGPGTADLQLRVGLHSGPVVAGVLRGEKSRFQLFGDTMNTASRMESTGVAGKVQVSEDTANILMAAGKSEWLERREERVEAKGKGEMSTFFLKDMQQTFTSKLYVMDETTKTFTSSAESQLSSEDSLDRRTEWTVEVLTTLLKEIEAHRRKSSQQPTARTALSRLESNILARHGGTAVADEIRDTVDLPGVQARGRMETGGIELDDAVVNELRDFVRVISSMYHRNSFHNLDHANHVVMSVVKLLSRINSDSETSDPTYNIVNDPLTRFSLVFSALIHDVDHLGVPNTQLQSEEHQLAKVYEGKSIAEQNSVVVAWMTLMDSKYGNLRRQIYSTGQELRRFRQLVVNAVMATDVFDKDLKAERERRWAEAFGADKGAAPSQVAVNRKATIVIDHLIQASDVAHTMQHWYIYQKWNSRLFNEQYSAWKAGRMPKDPSLTWFEGEIGFFDFYIIPLAKKLKDCGVFGVSSDEYLSYALQNRREWEEKGKGIVEDLVASWHAEHEDTSKSN